MQIFLSYASEDRDLAEEIQLALVGSGYMVFFDKASLPAGGDYHTQIESAVKHSDLLVFLISPASVARGSYALTELKFAHTKWPHPKGRLLPVRLHGTPWEAIPPYLKSVTMLEPEGNTAAEVVAAVAALCKHIRGRDPRTESAGVQDMPAVTEKREGKEASSRRAQIWVTMIGLVGVIGAAMIAHWSNILGPSAVPNGSPKSVVPDPRYFCNTATFTVNANKITETNLIIAKGSVIQARASGEGIKFSFDLGPGYGPSGEKTRAEQPFPGVGLHQLALLAQVGPDFYEVASGATFKARNEGKLRFQFNDWKLADNSGKAELEIRVQCP